jgi:uncharacterized protein YgbK (DUF1537 family)
MIEAVVIADDLTGALDTGIQFTKENLSTLVITELDFDIDTIPKDIEVIVIDTESRHIDKSEAKFRVKSIVSKLKKINNIKYFYKKIDSTFRGNIGQELEGFMEGLEIKTLNFIPGFPENGRVVQEGILYVDGKKITETAFANDILNPITHSYIPKIINQQTEIKVLRSKETEEKLKDEDKKIIYLYDSLTKGELELINQELKSKKQNKYLAGSAGFAEIIAKEIGRKKEFKKFEVKDKKILLVCGSVNKTSLEQCVYAQKNDYLVENLKFDDVIKKDYYKKNFTIKKEISELINRKNKILIKSSQDSNIIEATKKYSKENNIPLEEITQNVANNIGNLITFLIEKNDLKNIIIFGGDTLIGILKEMNITKIYPLIEITSGVVLAKVYFNDNELNIITKAGGFGNKDIIKDIEKFLEI